jgi:hypothetical protein
MLSRSLLKVAYDMSFAFLLIAVPSTAAIGGHVIAMRGRANFAGFAFSVGVTLLLAAVVYYLRKVHGFRGWPTVF